MTVYEGVPSFTTFLGMKLANTIAKRKRATEVSTRAVGIAQSIVRVLLTVAGFSCLTYAGFTWNMTAGLIVAGISAFVLAWLMNTGAPSEDNRPSPDNHFRR